MNICTLDKNRIENCTCHVEYVTKSCHRIQAVMKASTTAPVTTMTRYDETDNPIWTTSQEVTRDVQLLEGHRCSETNQLKG